MPDRRRVPLPFGGGLDRETGVMAVRPTRMDDLRNVYFRRGKLVVRRGLEQKLSFQDSAGNPATHILAGESLSSERSGVVVAYEQDNTGEVNVYQIDSEATVGDRIGTWFTQDVGDAPPIVITAESYGRVFFAHDELRASQREQTTVYDPRVGSGLQDLTADLRGEGQEPVRFRGVTRHLAYIFGYGFGHEGEDRPEMVRSSLPGAPAQFRPEHYWIVGDRRDPVMGVYRSGTSAQVFKEAETHEIFGSGRDNFGQRPLDTLHGILAPRLAVTVGDAVYGWSAEGPRRWRSGAEGSQDLALPLDLEGFEPTDLVARGDLRQGFAHYIPAERLVVFIFGQRVYALSIRQPNNPAWTYFELGVSPRCAFTLRSHGPGTGAESQTPPTGHPEYLENLSPRDADELRPQWSNIGHDGDERVDVWTRELNNLVIDFKLSDDKDGDGVVNGGTFTAEAGITATPSVDQAAQKIEVTGATGPGRAYVEFQDLTRDPVVAGEDYGISVSHQVANLVATGDAQIIYRWFDNAPSQVGPDHVVDPAVQPGEFEREFDLVATAPAGAVRLDVLVAFEASAAGDTGEVWFRLLNVDPVADRKGWVEQGRFQVATQGTQEQTIDGFTIGTFYEIALRYSRSVFVTSGYEGTDPTQWPQESRGALATTIEPVTIRRTWYTLRDDGGVYRASFEFMTQIENDIYQLLSEAQDAGLDAGVELQKQIPGVDSAFETVQEFTDLAVFETLAGGGKEGRLIWDAPWEGRGQDGGGLPGGWNGEPIEFQLRTFRGAVRSKWVQISRWPGRFGAPPDLTLDSPSAGKIRVRFSLDREFRDYPDPPTSLVRGEPPLESTAFDAMRSLIEYRNKTAGESSWSGGEPSLGILGDTAVGRGKSPNNETTLTGKNSGDTYEVRVRHDQLSLPRRALGPYSAIQEVVVT